MYTHSYSKPNASSKDPLNTLISYSTNKINCTQIHTKISTIISDNLAFFLFFKERLGLKLTHKRITTKVVLPVSKGKGAIQGEV